MGMGVYYLNTWHTHTPIRTNIDRKSNSNILLKALYPYFSQLHIFNFWQPAYAPRRRPQPHPQSTGVLHPSQCSASRQNW